MINKQMKYLDNGDIRYEIVDEVARTGLTNKITSPSTSGTEGQVLTIDSNGNPVWDDTAIVQAVDDGHGNVTMQTLHGALIDNVPTENSTNLISSGAVYTAINNFNNIYFITATYDNNNSVFVINKTFANIVEAINNGKVPILIADGQAWYWLFDKASSYLRFICIGANRVVNYIHIQSNGNVTFLAQTSANPSDYYTKAEIDNLVGDIATLLSQI